MRTEEAHRWCAEAASAALLASILTRVLARTRRAPVLKYTCHLPGTIALAIVQTWRSTATRAYCLSTEPRQGTPDHFGVAFGTARLLAHVYSAAACTDNLTPYALAHGAVR